MTIIRTLYFTIMNHSEIFKIIVLFVKISMYSVSCYEQLSTMIFAQFDQSERGLFKILDQIQTFFS